jgi:hypothetical protein
MTARERQMYEDLLWAQTNPEVEAKYLGEIVAVWNKQVVAHGKGEAAVRQQAIAADGPEHEIVIVEFPEFFEIPH